MNKFTTSEGSGNFENTKTVSCLQWLVLPRVYLGTLHSLERNLVSLLLNVLELSKKRET
jgi:hypothetical protein